MIDSEEMILACDKEIGQHTYDVAEMLRVPFSELPLHGGQGDHAVAG
ncbi:MAG: hypothetical protein R3E99_07560 [Burkholderiaceae bacterium]